MAEERVEPAVPPAPSRREFQTSFIARGGHALPTSVTVVGITTLGAWGILFGAGLLINTEPYRAVLGGSQPVNWLTTLQFWSVVVAAYTVTNTGILCCLASLLGGIYRYVCRFTIADSAPPMDARPAYLAYLIQGFVVYLVLISGLLLLGEDPFADMTSSKYLRLAGTASMLSFTAGYKPRLFIDLLERFERIGTPAK